MFYDVLHKLFICSPYQIDNRNDVNYCVTIAIPSLDYINKAFDPSALANSPKGKHFEDN